MCGGVEKGMYKMKKRLRQPHFRNEFERYCADRKKPGYDKAPCIYCGSTIKRRTPHSYSCRTCFSSMTYFNRETHIEYDGLGDIVTWRPGEGIEDMYFGIRMYVDDVFGG